MHDTKVPSRNGFCTKKYARISWEKFGNDDYQIVIAFALSNSDVNNLGKLCWQRWDWSHWSVYCHRCSAQKNWEIRFVTVSLFWHVFIYYLVSICISCFACCGILLTLLTTFHNLILQTIAQTSDLDLEISSVWPWTWRFTQIRISVQCTVLLVLHFSILCFSYYVHEGGCVFALVCLFVCLFVFLLAALLRKYVNAFSCNFWNSQLYFIHIGEFLGFKHPLWTRADFQNKNLPIIVG